MKEIDSILFLITVIVQADESNATELNFVRQKIFDRLEKAQMHSHEKTDANSIAIYLKFHVPEVMEQVNRLYAHAREEAKFQLPSELKIASRKHLENLHKTMSEHDLNGLIHEAIDADGEVSQQEIILRDFLNKEIKRIYT